ncbi:hypothetical protein [Tunturiibacter gelidoferens]|uniref:Uncharacterized protein n=1 Tax=Tunturiibacter gelidiferens TaxID=3069689 RepID=A0A9X0QK34_9BACT|nr:hypothetical protein [Edaphobacter lichenicola]MBB5331878.1 hypothetical protein [Edaphobacter lichenicola]
MANDEITPTNVTKLWVSLLERAVDRAQQSGKPFTIESLLDSCGIFHWSPRRSQAFAYATKLLSTTKGKT